MHRGSKNSQKVTLEDELQGALYFELYQKGILMFQKILKKYSLSKERLVKFFPGARSNFNHILTCRPIYPNIIPDSDTKVILEK
jgi:hypothetical protein